MLFELHLFKTNLFNFFQGTFQWETDIPVSFQQYLNIQYGNSKGILYSSISGDELFGNAFANNQILHRLESVYSQATKTMYPYIHTNDTCFIMLLVNLAEPDWIQIDCDKKLLSNVLCVIKGVNSEEQIEPNITLINNKKSCTQTYVLMYDVCYLFLWYEGMEGDTMDQSCKNNNAFSVNLENITIFQNLFDAVPVEFPPILSTHLHEDHLYKFTYRKYVNIYIYSQEPILGEMTEGLHLCLSEKQPVSAGDNLFPCEKGSFVSYTFICNGRVDCPFDNSDERVNCSFFTNTQNSMKKFPSCSSLFYMKHDNSCIPFFSRIEDS